MSTKTEIELKLKVEDLHDVAVNLRAMEVTDPNTVKRVDLLIMQDNYYHYDPRNKHAVRLREVLNLTTQSVSFELTVKKPSTSAANAREECEATISKEAHEAMSAAFEAMGISRLVQVSKIRSVYNIYADTDNSQLLVEIALDQVEGLGHFVELEYKGDNDDEAATVLQQVRERLGLGNAIEPKKGYALLALENISGVENQPAGEGTPQQEIPPNGSGSQEE